VATHNGLLIQICDVVNGARHQPLWGRLKQRSFTPQRCLDYIHDHREIYEALLDRDSSAAQAAMRAHILRVQANIFGGL
jgi:DNA-binding GntR family transcriptional regulator